MWLFKFCFLFILPSIIYGIELKEYLDQMAVDNEKVNNLFELVPNGFLGEGTFAVVYKGIRISDRRPVALKFVLKDHEAQTQQEYEICTYLDAIDRPDIEQFGIPAIYYYGEFLDGSFILMALSSLEEDLFTKASQRHFVQHPVNNLILLKQFIVTSKYIHSKGVRHDDIKPENIMLRKYRSFLIDFNLSCKILQKKHGGTIEYVARRAHNFEMRKPIDDFESFLYTICELNFVKLRFLPHMGFDISDTGTAFREAGVMKSKTNETITQIKLDIRSPILRTVLVKFAEHVLLSNENFPDYDSLYQMVDEAIEAMVKPLRPNQVFFTWLSEADVIRAKMEIASHSIPDIENALIRMPQTIDFTKYSYPKPHFNKFGGFGLMTRVSSTVSGVMKSFFS